jgi:hypothetical protein
MDVDERRVRRTSRHMARLALRGLLAVSCVGALLASAPAPVAQAKPVTYVTFDCYHARTAPNSIMFACADAGFYVKRLNWSRWGVRGALAQGVFFQNDCDPNCAAGTFRSRKGSLTLSGRLWCSNIDAYVFRRTTAVYRHPLNGQMGYSGKLFCPLGGS